MSDKEPRSELNPIDSPIAAAVTESSDLLRPENPLVGEDTAPEALATTLSSEVEMALSVYPLPGQILAARRRELRWSEEEAAERLKLTPRQVISLEADDFASLPGMASVRGFVRAYAKLLGLDPQQLLDLLANEPNPAHGPMVLRRPLPTNGFPGRRSSPPPHGSKWRRRLGLVLMLVIATAAIGVGAYRSQWLPASVLEDWPFSVSVPEVNRISADLMSVLESIPVSKGSDDPGKAETDAESAAAAPVRSSVLELRIKEDAWIEITTLSGQKIVSRLMKRGTTESIDINEPAILVVGNASAVDAKLRGQALNLTAVARDNVSKLSLK